MYIGDYSANATVRRRFLTVTSSGVGSALSTTAVVKIYKDASTTPSTAGVTLTRSHAGITGNNLLQVATTASTAFYTAGSNFFAILTVGTVNSASVVGYQPVEWSIHNRSALRPTVSGRTLDVASGGEAGLDWSNMTGSTTARNLSATNIDVDQVVASVSGAVGSVTGAVGSVTGAVGSVTGAVGSVTGNVGGNVTGSVGSVVGAVGSVTGAVGSVTGLTASDVGAIKAKTDNLPADPADESNVLAAIAAVQADTDNIQTRIPAGLSTGGYMKANVNAVNDIALQGVGSTANPWRPV